MKFKTKLVILITFAIFITLGCTEAPDNNLNAKSNPITDNNQAKNNIPSDTYDKNSMNGEKDTDGDGFPDLTDDFPLDPNYHEICPKDNGTGLITKTQFTEIKYTEIGGWEYTDEENIGLGISKAIGQYLKISVTNIDNIAGPFEVFAYIERKSGMFNKEIIWEQTQKSFIDPGQSYDFNFYLGDEGYFDDFYDVATDEVYWEINAQNGEIVQVKDPYCGGLGKI